ncbi:MAG: M4 family metallopeptidase [Clostridia bacterium]|nr:M4 family metallopeptidase [Clostridia bacterium]
MKKAVVVLLLALCLMSVAILAVADSVLQENAQLILTANKNSYLGHEDITISLSMENLTGEYISNVQMQLNLPNGYIWQDEQAAAKTVSNMAAGEKQALTATAAPFASVIPATGDRSSFGMWLSVLSCVSVIWLMVFECSSSSKRMMALLLCIGFLTSACVPVQAESIHDWPQKMAAFSRMRRTGSPVHEMTVTHTVTVDGRDMMLSAVVRFSTMGENDNQKDDVIDYGDIEIMRQRGEIDLITNNQGNIAVIDGTFTDKRVFDSQDAADVLNSASSLFGDGFYVDRMEISHTHADYGDGRAEDIYVYSPIVYGLSVIGCQIVLVVDEDGAVDSLFSTYDNRIKHVNVATTIASEEAINSAKAALLGEEEITSFIDSVLNENTEVSESQVMEAFWDTLLINVEQVIYGANDSLAIANVYAVRFLTKDSIVENTTNDELPYFPLVDETYYVYANGENAGTIHSVMSGILPAWENTSITAKGLGGKYHRISVQKNDRDRYRLMDGVRNIGIYETQFKGFGYWREPIVFNVSPKEFAMDNILGIDKPYEDAVTLMANYEKVFDYYQDVLGRNSYDDNGSELRVFYKFFKPNENTTFEGGYKNTAWYTGWNIIGIGEPMENPLLTIRYASAIDLMGHEFTHGVQMNNGHGGMVRGQQSGALMEAYADIMGSLIEGKDRNSNGRWRIAEDIENRSYYRSMADPTEKGDHLDHFRDYDENLGFYKNSTIFSHATYRMIMKLGERVSDKDWSKVFYRSMIHLPSDATFLIARGAVVNAAKNLGFDSDMQTAIKDAFDEVGISPPSSLRIVLRWGEIPADLDSHLVGPGVGSERFHVYFGQKSYDADGEYESDAGLCFAELDYDDVTSFGPEITTIYELTPGTYYFYVHDYTTYDDAQSTALAQSRAQVQIFRGSGKNALRTFHVDTGSAGTIWNVFKITIDSSGLPFVEAINSYGNDVMYQ